MCHGNETRGYFPDELKPSGFSNGCIWREADVGAAKESATIKSGRSVQLGRTKEGKQTQAFGRPKLA
jgi:hypothetical protein